MTITQTVDIPDSHRLVIDVPREVPAGRSVLTFSPKAEQELAKGSWFSRAKGMYKTKEEIHAALGTIQEICKDAPISVDGFLEMRRQEKDIEEKRYQQFISRHEGN
jgi:hypothetical protein